MNPPPPPPQPQQPPQIQPHRPSISSTTCDLHPTEQFTGFCPLCLFDRLSLLDPTTTTTNPKSSTTTTGAIKNLFKPTFPELRRTKSFSVSNRETNNFSGTLFEPQRKSCDVRGRNNINTLWCLFNQPTDPHRKSVSKEKSSAVDEIEVVENYNVACSSSTTTNTSTSRVVDSVLESKGDEFDEIRVCSRENCEDGKNVKTMKDYIDLDLHKKKNSTIAGSFMSAASGFSKKLQQKWRHSHKTNKDRKMLPVEKSIGRQYRETQSEIADYGFGRRSSCDTDPRFSLDVGRMSFDEPRVSWDGHSMARTFTRMAPPMLSVVEDDVVQVHVPRTDSQIPVEQTSGDDDEVPGGSAQTRDYYLDSSSKRRKSLDRSTSLRKITVGASVMVPPQSEEMMKPVSNARVSPKSLDRSSSLRKTTVAAAAASVLVPQSEETMKPVSNARVSPDDCADAFKMGFRDNASIMGDGEKREPSKKSSRWSKALNIWGLIIQRRGGMKEHNGAELGRSFSQSWHDVRIEHNGNARGDFNRNMFRSNSSVNWRNSNGFEGSTSFRSSSVRKANNVDTNGHDKKRKDNCVLERNRSARYSPNHVDNGLLRFYLNPLAGNWRSSSTGKSRPNNTHSIARSVLGLY